MNDWCIDCMKRGFCEKRYVIESESYCNTYRAASEDECYED